MEWTRKWIAPLAIVLILVVTMNAGASIYQAPMGTPGTAVWTTAYETGQGEIEARVILDPDDLELNGWPRAVDAIPYGDGFATLINQRSLSRIYRFDPDGQALGQIQIPQSYARGIVEGEDASIYAFSVDPPHLPPKAHLTKLDSNGDIVWSNAFPAENRIWGTAAELGPDGNIHMFMTSRHESAPCTAPSTTQLIRTDPSGQSTLMTIATEPGDFMLDIASAAEGTSYLVGTHCFLFQDHPLSAIVDIEFTLKRPLLLHVDSDGEILSRKVLWDWKWDRTMPRQMDVGPDGSIWLTGASTPSAGQTALGANGESACYALFVSTFTCTDRAFVARFTPQLDLLWRTHLVIGQQSHDGRFDFHPDGGIVVSGTARHDTAVNVGIASQDVLDEHQAYMAHVNPDGTIEWMRSFDDTDQNPAEALTSDWCVGKTQGHHVVVTGNHIWSIGKACVGEPNEIPDPLLLSRFGRFDLFLARAPIHSENAYLTGPLATAASNANQQLTDGGDL